jgi:uncharacterized protein (UPF0335 family)
MADMLNVPQLRQLADRIGWLEEEKSQVASDIKDMYAEAKAHGYDAKIIRKVIARRRRDRAELAEEEALIELYERAIREASPAPLLDAMRGEPQQGGEEAAR